MIRLAVVLLTIFCAFGAMAQEGEDSVQASRPFEVVVSAFEQNRRLLDVAAPVSRIGSTELNRFNNLSFVHAINTLPGVRMEERSPGSYRINIRGSALRSPFGVRNVKVYFNGIPFTDPGGNTYLNQLGFYNAHSIEVVKGPGSSLYGAGTGGVMLIESMPNATESGVKIDYTAGSFGMHNTNVNATWGSEQQRSMVNYQHQTSDGYREQSAMRRDIVSYQTTIRHNANELSAHFLYGDLYYQTPGALTQAEYNANPRAARPRVGAAPGAAEVQAAIFLKTFLAGVNYKQVLSNRWVHTTALYGAFAELKNPAIRNYGRNAEPHFGGRTFVRYAAGEGTPSSITWHTGVEYQKGINTVQVFNNRRGQPDSLLTNDDINNSQYFIFSQASWQLNNWIITGGLSFNKTEVQLARTTSRPALTFKRSYANELAPRLAVLNKVTNNISVYASVSKGFSPPTIGEVSPSGSAINNSLNAEQGTNYEVGIKGSALQSRLYWEATAFYFKISDAIVQRRDALGGDYFLNAGSTNQKGVETNISYRLASANNKVLTGASRLWFTQNIYRFRYADFAQLETNFSGKNIPGVAPYSSVVGLDLYAVKGFYLNTTYTYSDAVALNDANTAKATAFNLLAFRGGYKKVISKKLEVELFAGADNVFDVRYSLGNDLNAFGGRYYNAAPGRNYFAGVSFRFLKKAV